MEFWKEDGRDALLDGWKVEGNDRKELETALKELSGRTKTMLGKSDSIGVVTELGGDGRTMTGFVNDVSGTRAWTADHETLKKEAGATDRLIRETSKNSHMLITSGRQTFFVGNTIMSTLGARAGVNGKALRDEDEKIRLLRDSLIVRELCLHPAQTKTVYREIDGAKKIFAVHTDRQGSIPQDEAFEAAMKAFEKTFGPGVVTRFRIDNYLTDVEVEFPEGGKRLSEENGLPDVMVPGVHVQMSDVGESSFKVIGTFSRGKSVVAAPGAYGTLPHLRKNGVKEIEGMISTKIVPEYGKLAKKMGALTNLEVSDPAELVRSLAKEADVRNSKTSGLGVNPEHEIVETAIATFDPKRAYTAYDVVGAFIAQAERYDVPGIPYDTLEKIRGCFAKAFSLKRDGSARKRT